MANSAKIKMTMGFADDDKRLIELDAFNPNSKTIENAKARIKSFDANAIKGVYLSNGGATCTGVTAATIVETEENEINLNE